MGGGRWPFDPPYRTRLWVVQTFAAKLSEGRINCCGFLTLSQSLKILTSIIANYSVASSGTE